MTHLTHDLASTPESAGRLLATAAQPVRDGDLLEPGVSVASCGD